MLGPLCDITRGSSSMRAGFHTPGSAEYWTLPSFGDLVDGTLSECCVTFTAASLESKCGIHAQLLKYEPAKNEKLFSLTCDGQLEGRWRWEPVASQNRTEPG